MNKVVLILCLMFVASSFPTDADILKGGLFSGKSKSNHRRSDDMSPRLAPEEVKRTVKELKTLRPYLNETCVFGAAMMLNNMADKVPYAMDTETKCIYSLVMFKQRHDQELQAKLNS